MDSVRKSYTIQTLPEKFWKKYRYIHKFIDLIRSKTPKVIFYSPHAKCMLMENEPTGDIEMYFYNGCKLTLSGESQNIEIIENQHLTSFTRGNMQQISKLSSTIVFMYKHLEECRQFCSQIEKSGMARLFFFQFFLNNK